MTPESMRALSIRSPWWWFILHGGKDIENRDWSTDYRGRILIHASSWFNREEVLEDARGAAEIMRVTGHKAPVDRLTLRSLHEARGCLVGAADVVDCVSSSESPWFFGKHGLVLANPVTFARPVPVKGALGLFKVPADVVAGIPEIAAAALSGSMAPDRTTEVRPTP